MRVDLRTALIAAGAAVVSGLAYAWAASHRAERSPAPAPAYPSATVPRFPDPAPVRGSSTVFVDPFEFDHGVFDAAARFTGDYPDDSLRSYREAIAGRVPRAKSWLAGQESRLRLGPRPTPDDVLAAVRVCREGACVALYEGDHEAASAWLTRGLGLARMHGTPPEARAHITALLGLNALRRGEQDNCVACVGPSSCIFPIAPGAVHARPSGSREAVSWFTAYLDEWPGDLRVRWLLNVAYMTLGEYPDKVPPGQLIPVARPAPAGAPGRFENVASLVGLTARGPDLAGGSLFDDFTGDGRPDVFTTTFDVNHGASLYVNRGDGTFEDRSEAAGLGDQVYSLNATRADYDNDGDLDILMLRGGWEKPARMSLLRNKGDGVFEDVTAESGLGTPIATESAAWADYDNDGLLDVFVCGEYRTPSEKGLPDARNRCRLYHNEGGGRFADRAAEAGVENERWAKGSAWGDYDGDGRIDLFVSNMKEPPRLYHNEGGGRFVDAAGTAGIVGPPHGFACMFWDYDNDGRPDVFVSDWGGGLADFVGDYLGLPVGSDDHARVYHNLGGGGFREVSGEVGLARPLPVMSVNAGDLDNDGDLDLHLGTGWMSLSGLVPDRTYLNDGGRFDDATDATATGHLQKGHGVAFADWDDDGDLDLFVVLGGGFPGDRGYNALFQNPGHGRHWLKLRLVGTASNRSAIGARIQVDLKRPGGETRSVHRVVGNNGSFGGNTLTEHIGLGDATAVERVTVTWPRDGSVQTFRGVAGDQSLEITEGAGAYKVLPRRPLPPPTP